MADKIGWSFRWLIQALVMTSYLLTNMSSISFHNPKIKAIIFFLLCKERFSLPQYSCPSPWQNSSASFFSFLHYKGTSKPRLWSSPLGQLWRAGQGRWIIAIALFSCWLLVFVHLSRFLLLLVCNQGCPLLLVVVLRANMSFEPCLSQTSALS